VSADRPAAALDTAEEAREVRTEDSFELAEFDGWLRGVLKAMGEASLPTGLPEVRQFPGGASNLTYLVRYPGADAHPDRDLVLRMPPRGTKAASAHNMRREFEI
jgi:aminoglycoside phosphotransferase (APT) family kinase protein